MEEPMGAPLLRARHVRHGLLVLGVACLAVGFMAMRPSADSATSALGELIKPAAAVAKANEEVPAPLRVRLASEPSPLVIDPYAERFSDQPKELRAVLGTHRGRHFGAVACLCYSPDGKLLASGGEDGAVRLWQADTLVGVDVLRGHTTGVRTIAFSADGKLLASFGRDKAIRLWDLRGKTAQERAVLAIKDESWWGSLAFSADGNTLWGAANFNEDDVHAWTIGPSSVKERARLSHPNLIPQGYSFSTDGTRFAADARAKGSDKNEVGLWDTTGYKLTLLSRWGDHKELITRTVFSPDGKLLISLPMGGGSDPLTKIWDVTRMPPRLVAELPNTVRRYVYEGKLKTTYSPDRSYAISPDNRVLAKGGQRRPGFYSHHEAAYSADVELWDLKTSPPQRVSILSGHETDSIATVVYSPDGKSLATGSFHGLIQLWDVRGKSPAPFPTFPGSSFRAKSVSVSPVGEAIAVVGSDGTLRVFEHDRGLYYERGMIKGAKTAAFSPDGATLAVAGHSTLRLWNFREGRLTERTGSLPGVASPVRLTFASDGRTLAVGDAGGEVRLWSLTGPNHLLRGPASAVADMVFRADGSELTVLHENRTVACWDLVSGEKKSSWPLPKDECVAALLPNGRTAITADEKGQLRKYEITGRAPAASPLFGSRAGEISLVVPDRSGTRLASVGKDRRVVIWELVGGKKIVEWPFPGPVEAIAFTPDGRRVVTLNGNGTCYVLALPAQ
jgi:WD40 repeat protein